MLPFVTRAHFAPQALPGAAALNTSLELAIVFIFLHVGFDWS
jgi:hypothetical protein